MSAKSTFKLSHFGWIRFGNRFGRFEKKRVEENGLRGEKNTKMGLGDVFDSNVVKKRREIQEQGASGRRGGGCEKIK